MEFSACIVDVPCASILRGPDRTVEVLGWLTGGEQEGEGAIVTLERTLIVTLLMI